MDQQKVGRTSVKQKIISAPSQAPNVQPKQLVTIRTWRESQNPEQSITGQYLIGNNQLNQNIQQIILQMKVGDQWKINCYNNVSQNQQTINVQVVQAKKPEKQGGALKNTKSSNERAQQSKKQGNNFIKQKKYQQAIQSYQNCYNFVQYSCDQEGVDIRLSVASNLALATLSINKYKDCLYWCNKYLTQALQPNKKVIYRQVSAYKGLKQWNLAKQKANKALQMFKNDPQAVSDFKNIKQAIQKEQKIQLAKQKQVYVNMFG